MLHSRSLSMMPTAVVGHCDMDHIWSVSRGRPGRKQARVALPTGVPTLCGVLALCHRWGVCRRCAHGCSGRRMVPRGRGVPADTRPAGNALLRDAGRGSHAHGPWAGRRVCGAIAERRPGLAAAASGRAGSRGRAFLAVISLGIERLRARRNDVRGRPQPWLAVYPSATLESASRPGAVLVGQWDRADRRHPGGRPHRNGPWRPCAAACSPRKTR